MILDAAMESNQFPEKLNIQNLNDVLKIKLDGSAKSGIVAYQQRKLIEEIVNYVGEDPLQPWIRFIKWAKDTFESGSKSELVPLLELCTKTFLNHKQYYEDLRYLRIWVRYAACCSDPLTVFTTMEDKQIGQEHSLFYEAYAVELEIQKDLSKANEVYLKGLVRQAQPLDQLEKTYRAFLKRNENLANHQWKGLASIKFARQPLSTLADSQFSMLERSDLSQYNCKKDNISQIPRSATSESQQVLDVFVDVECAREVKNSGKQNSSSNFSDLKANFDRITSSVDGSNLEGKRQAIHAFKFPEGVDLSFEELRVVSWTASQNANTEDIHVRQTQVGLPDILPSANCETFCSLQGHEATSATTESQRPSLNDFKSSKGRVNLLLNDGSAPNKVNSLYFSKDSSPIAWNDGTATVCGSSKLEGQTESIFFSSRKSLPIHGDETIAIKKFVDVAISSRIDPKEGNTERHHCLVDPTINTKEAMADILSLFNKPLPFEHSRKKKTLHEPDCRKELYDESQGFLVLADDNFNNSQVRRQDVQDKFEASKNMDFAVLVDDDLKESYSCPKTLDLGLNMVHKQEEKFQISKAGKSTGFPRALANKSQLVDDGQSSQKMKFVVYIDDHLKFDDAKHQGKENRISLTGSPDTWMGC